ncbi:hypothetical protein L917_12419 [Phytophthora nicotianae]|uniref:Uncharacterized protein n=1 Tax=Phytophthora nicotianae TaxID=4792 RepID=W2KTR6_PHYNI|nr:hypothetical protein L917_12419 [Phytophthora nicotianae]
MQEQVKSNPRWSTWYYVHSTFDTDDNVLAAINRLHGDLGQLFAETDRAFMSNGLEACMSPFAFANVNTTSDTTSYIEVLFCRILPFDHNTVGDCFWHEMIKYDVENAVERGQSQREAKAAAVSQAFTMDSGEYGSLLKMQFRYAGKRIVDQHRQVAVRSGQSQFLEAFGIPVIDVHVQEKQWLVLSELSPGMTMMKVCLDMYVHFNRALPNHQQFVDQTCQVLAKQKQLGFESVLQDIEQSLLVGDAS